MHLEICLLKSFQRNPIQRFFKESNKMIRCRQRERKRTLDTVTYNWTGVPTISSRLLIWDKKKIDASRYKFLTITVTDIIVNFDYFTIVCTSYISVKSNLFVIIKYNYHISRMDSTKDQY